MIIDCIYYGIYLISNEINNYVFLHCGENSCFAVLAIVRENKRFRAVKYILPTGPNTKNTKQYSSAAIDN